MKLRIKLQLEVLFLVLLGILVRNVSSIDIALTFPSKSCVMDRVKRMMAYGCNDLRLKEVPQYMKSGVEIMDLSENRIRDLTRESFQKYTSLKFLYLYDNMIQTVDPGTFSQLTSLEVVDLSSNALTTIPSELFHLRYLRTLYAADNNLFHLEADLEGLIKPITAPLQILSLSSCKLQSIPNFGVLPNLIHANFSKNPMTRLDIDQLAPMCVLKTVDLSGTEMSGCVCQQLRTYLSATSVFIKNGPFSCQPEGDGCLLDASTNTTEQLFNQCVSSKAALVQEEIKSSMLVYSAIAAGCLLLILLLCCCCMRNRKIKRQRKEQQKLAAARRRARKMKEAAEQKLLSSEQSKSTDSGDSLDEKKKNNIDYMNIIQVDIEKEPPG